MWHVILGGTRWNKKCNIELWSVAGIERVEVIVMRRRLHWLSTGWKVLSWWPEDGMVRRDYEGSEEMQSGP